MCCGGGWLPVAADAGARHGGCSLTVRAGVMRGSGEYTKRPAPIVAAGRFVYSSVAVALREHVGAQDLSDLAVDLDDELSVTNGQLSTLAGHVSGDTDSVASPVIVLGVVVEAGTGEELVDVGCGRVIHGDGFHGANDGDGLGEGLDVRGHGVSPW
jgi:hypothetical protein